MRVMLLVIVALSMCVPAMAQQAPEGGLIPPPAINIPYGGKIVTEINFSDTDMLGIIRQMILAADDTAKKLAVSMKSDPNANADMAAKLEIVGKLDIPGLLDAVKGVKNVRVLVVQYPGKVSTALMLQQFDAGVAKTGRFSKILSDIGFFPGATAIYAQENNQGYVAFGYEPNSKVLYAARVVGNVDVQKLTAWLSNAGIMFANYMNFSNTPAVVIPQEVPQPLETPAPTE